MNYRRFFPLLFAGVFVESTKDIPVYMAMRQNNIDVLERHLYEISNPLSYKYGTVLSKSEIRNIIEPSYLEQQEVLQWLYNNGVYRVKNYGDSMRFLASQDKIKQLFSMSSLDDRVTDKLLDYTIPDHLTNIIEFVEMYHNEKNTRQAKNGIQNAIFGPPQRSSDTDDRFFARESLMRMYNVSSESISQDVVGVLAEFQSNGGFSPQDLTIHQAVNGQDKNPVTRVVGGNIGIDVESVLDVQMMSQAGNGMDIWFWDSPYWLYAFAVDYFNSQNIGDIVSMSWGWSEDSQCDIVDCSAGLTSQKYVERVNNEFLKIALRGVTIVVASGDAGAPGRTNEGCDYERPINPVFPGSSKYVTSIGATSVPMNATILNTTTPLCKNSSCIVSEEERSISFEQVGWTAGGGFDLYEEATPWWQSTEVFDYFKKDNKSLPAQGLFNQNGRAYPDVTAIGHSCPVIINSQVGSVDGTSCSTPIVAGLLAVVSKHLWENHGKRLGFVNPLLYYLYKNCENCFKDITVGHNWCTEDTCCDNSTNFGFSATNGYDPVSGLGSLNVGNIIDFISIMN